MIDTHCHLNDNGNQRKIHLHMIKPEFFKWTGSKFENVFVGVCSIIIDEQKVVLYSLPKYYPKSRCKREHLDDIKEKKIGAKLLTMIAYYAIIRKKSKETVKWKKKQWKNRLIRVFL